MNAMKNFSKVNKVHAILNKKFILKNFSVNQKIYFKVNQGLQSNEFKLPLLKDPTKNFDYSLVNPNAEVENDLIKEETFDFLTVYFSENDKVKDLQSKVENSFNGKIQLDFKENENLTMRELLSKDFLVNINFKDQKYKSVDLHSIPDLNRLLGKFYIGSNFSRVDEFNNLLLSNSSSLNKKDIISFLEKEISNYSDLLKKIEEREQKLENETSKKSEFYGLLGLLYFLGHLILFYVLIFQLYGWDNIEPITYLVGNCYWIFALGFFAFKKKKLDIDLLYSKGFKAMQYQIFSKKLNYSRKSHFNIYTQLSELSTLRDALNKKI